MSETKATTSIKTTQAVRDRLKVLADERHMTLTALLAELAEREPTEAEREQRAQDAARELGIEYTPKMKATGASAWEKIRTHRAAGHSSGRAA
ncbi:MULTISPECIES: hypothetical protein [unclassified Streptomyces]|uniref:hypothetical protein n=1 Tax=unclassified Streptomyces TaxID=2593676 RepID=UPI002253E0B3|nr:MULTISPECIES: hypothetical protein [unclassified Streptomyces]MCX5443797.1 hypothetical protein [Streptomyces sp. NBC_00063]WUB90865.1 hypothetical protein OHO83_00115 [Streptomyces sp. NBC_00569]WUB99174.1 hypothetical protein OHO83_46775 [Streptomyces sp. NBC_00569]